MGKQRDLESAYLRAWGALLFRQRVRGNSTTVRQLPSVFSLQTVRGYAYRYSNTLNDARVRNDARQQWPNHTTFPSRPDPTRYCRHSICPARSALYVGIRTGVPDPVPYSRRYLQNGISSFFILQNYSNRGLSTKYCIAQHL